MKKFIIRMFIVIAILLFVTAFCFENMKRNSVYYAKHTPHKEGTEPVLMMLVDNLFWINTPEIDGIEYDFDGPPCVQFFNSNGKQIGYIAPFRKKNYIYDDGEWEIRLILDCNFNPEIAHNDRHEKIQITKLDIKGIKQKLYNNLQPIIDAQRKPKVNLQWLFDIVYKDKFN